ncbi:hypothetical protein STEG23_036453, partial [Scotinomys teguina]
MRKLDVQSIQNAIPPPVYVQCRASNRQSDGIASQQGINKQHLGRLPGPTEQPAACVLLNNCGFDYKVRKGSSCEEFTYQKNLGEVENQTFQTLAGSNFHIMAHGLS